MPMAFPHLSVGVSGAKQGFMHHTETQLLTMNSLLAATTTSPPSHLLSPPWGTPLLPLFSSRALPLTLVGFFHMGRECSLSHNPSGRPFWKVGAPTTWRILPPTDRLLTAPAWSCCMANPPPSLPPETLEPKFPIPWGTDPQTHIIPASSIWDIHGPWANRRRKQARRKTTGHSGESQAVGALGFQLSVAWVGRLSGGALGGVSLLEEATVCHWL